MKASHKSLNSLTRIEKHNRSQATQLGLVHAHIAKLGDKLIQHAVHYGADTRLLCVFARHRHAIGEYQLIVLLDRPIAKLGDQQLIPTRFQQYDLILE